jgi:polygalacturonase
MATNDEVDPLLSEARPPAPASPGRRAFMAFAGVSAGAGLLAASRAAVAADPTFPNLPAPGGQPPAPPAGDPIWGPDGQATRILRRLDHVNLSMFRRADFHVTSYGARPLPASALISSIKWPTGPIPWVNGTEESSHPTNDLQSPGSAWMVPSETTGTQYDSNAAFNAAIVDANRVGGGRVVVPAGNWYCGGPIVLLSNVEFHLESGCTIYFSPNPADYAKNGPYKTANGNLYHMRWQANDCLNFGSPIYAFRQHNIAVTADDNTCVLNGQAMTPIQPSSVAPTSCWWTYKGSSNTYGCAGSSTPSQAYVNPNNVALTSLPAAEINNPQASVNFTNQYGATSSLMDLLDAGTSWAEDQNYLPALSELRVPFEERIFGNGHYLRPCMIEFISCRDVYLQNYHTQNTPFWQHHPVDCKNVVIDGVFADSVGPNNDGFDPDACDHVLVQNVQFNTGDDCIAMKSGKYLDTEYGPMQNIVVQNCTMQSGHGGLTLGSELSAGIQNVYARNLTMQNENWATNPLNIALRFKTNMNRGGFINNVWINGVTLANGVNLAGKYGGGALGIAISPITGTGTTGLATNPSTGQGGLITFDCDYSPSGDAVRWTPSVITNINITNVNASNVSGTVSYSMPSGFVAGSNSCFQALVMQGPEKWDYNGPVPVPTISPISGVTISNSNLGNPVCTGAVPTTPSTSSSAAPGPVFVSNVSGITLSNVVIAGTTYNTTLTAPQT